MDELGRHNQQRWDELAAAGVAYSRPWLDLDADGRPDPSAPGAWGHFCAEFPPWLALWARLDNPERPRARRATPKPP